MATLSLNGSFSYPVEIKQSLTVDGKADFNNAIVHGYQNGDAAQYSFVTGNRCVAKSMHSFSAGISSYTGPDAAYSRADGYQCSGYGEYSRSYGWNARADDARSFVWQGLNSDIPYVSRGSGTFCINPEYNVEGMGSVPICGFYIGDSCITDYISSHSALRILTNPNLKNGTGAFSAPQEFADNVLLSGNVTSYSEFVYADNSTVVFDGKTIVNRNNEIDSSLDGDNERSVASLKYARGVALSAISNAGEYFPINNLESIDFDELSSYAVSLDFVRTYVASSINDVETFYDSTSGYGSVATREYSLNIATSASTHTLTSDNSFTGVNKFGSVEITGRNAILLRSSTASADFRQGTVLVREPSDINELNSFTPATERYVRNVATSAVESILKYGNTYGRSRNDSNTYVSESLFRGPTTFYGSVSLDSASVANFSNGTLYVNEPSKTSMMSREPATTLFTRNTALSAVDTLLERGGTFSGKSKLVFNGDLTFNTTVDFTKSKTVEVNVKTQNIKNKVSNFAASTEYVGNYVTDTISTSAISVKNLILNGNEESRVNNFTTYNDFRNGDILVDTVEDTSEYDHYAASCEFVKHKLNSIAIFDLFDMKFLDYRLPDTSSWKMAGSFVKKATNPKVYEHIYNDIVGTTPKQETINNIQIKYYLGEKYGHKVVMSSDRSFIDTLFNRTGIAWYYILDTTPNKEGVWLPRSTYNFNISTTGAGTYIQPSLPSHKHSVTVPRSADGSHGSGVAAHHGGDSICSSIGCTTSAPDNAIYKDGATVQPPATKMFLYFYCG